MDVREEPELPFAAARKQGLDCKFMIFTSRHSYYQPPRLGHPHSLSHLKFILLRILERDAYDSLQI
jgi:hypothetical protein